MLAAFKALSVPACECGDCIAWEMYRAEEAAVYEALNDRAKTFASAGFDLSYADPGDVADGRISNNSLSHSYSGGYRVRDISGEPSIHGQCLVDIGDVAAGEDSYGQVSTCARSNFVTLRRDYSDFPWVIIRYGNVDHLGFFLADVDDDMENAVIGLKEQYPIHDESHLSELEHEEQYASWGEYLAWEVRTECKVPAMWDFLGEEAVAELWWDCVREEVFGNYPEHNGLEVVWGDISERWADFRPYLTRAYLAKRNNITLGDRWIALVSSAARANRRKAHA